ncbi:Transposable element P transposase [Aphis craccivora]|uniref:Transposable element P transposase n=1 Tax=Aphis craccivora TaxID=307492 RepID=A0A6G0YKG9_APHCR|nr:Transposable element P transposase [Aphis craccivora]
MYKKTVTYARATPGGTANFYNTDIKIKPRLAKLPPFSLMRVCLAAQTFSNSVSAGILTLVSLNLQNVLNF